ncbi:hypothetical protein [Humidesulfovibrio sp.]|uniref:hypothetical protein n=1 Tax=Humidesulfovibrio sp. TaxID=2910988 RepID=UPI00273713E7|nr:hypothetical protein [Humidesulfovibrio sp.]
MVQLLGAGQCDEYYSLIERKEKDDIDFACKLHDLCYLLAGGGSKACDAALLQNVNRISSSMAGSPIGVRCWEECARVMNFSVSGIGSLRDQEDWREPIVLIPTMAVRTGRQSIEFLFLKAITGSADHEGHCSAKEDLSFFGPTTPDEYRTLVDCYRSGNSLNNCGGVLKYRNVSRY